MTREFLDTAGTDLSILGQTLETLVDRHGLPIHVRSVGRIRANLQAFRRVFAQRYPKGALRFAVKAGPDASVLEIVRGEGVGADVASPGELERALAAGIPPAEIDVNGSAKTDGMITTAVETGMLLIADSIDEVSLIDRLAREAGQPARVLLRLSGFDLGPIASEHVLTSGRWSKFGMTLDAVREFLTRRDLPAHVRLLGFHTHLGSQITRPEPYLTVFGWMAACGHLLERVTGTCEIINLGGGFPVSYVDEERWNELSQGESWGREPGDDAPADVSGSVGHTPFPKADMLAAILDGQTTVGDRPMPVIDALRSLGNPTLIAEPGRAVMEDAGVTLCRVMGTKPLDGDRHLTIVDLGVTGHCNALIERTDHRWLLANDHHRVDPEPFTTYIAGNLCFSGDILARRPVTFPRRLQRGDILAICDTGAYSSHFLASEANSFPRLVGVMVE